MALADAPDSEARMKVIDAAKALDIPIVVHFGSGYGSTGTKLRLHLEPHEISEAEGADTRVRRADIKVVANVKPCLLGDHPHYGESRRPAVSSPAATITRASNHSSGAAGGARMSISPTRRRRVVEGDAYPTGHQPGVKRWLERQQ